MKLSPALKKILITLILVALCGIAIYVDAFRIEPKRITVRYETIESIKIKEDLNGLTVCVFSDLHYGSFVNRERAQAVIEKINAENPDVVIFLGDLFDHPGNNPPTESMQNELIILLSQIQAPYGKFAIHGDQDLESAYSSEIIDSVLYQSGFEVFVNSSFDIHLAAEGKITFIALDSQLYGTLEPYSAFLNADMSNYNIVLCHTPDTIDELDEFDFDRMLAGHSNGGQVYIPLIGAIYVPQFAYKYNHGTYYVNNHLLDITNGVGTTNKDVRFLAPQEIVIYKFYHKN